MKTKLVGEAKNKTIKRICCLCKDNFVMTTNDYIFNNCGIILKRENEGADSWICKDCASKVQ